MNPSVIREILKVTERPGIISLAGGLPSPDTFPVEAMREATARVLRDTPREALQYAASEGYAPLREWVAAHMARRGCAVDAGAGADHHRLAAGPGPGRQGADRPRQPRRGRVADLPRRPAGLRAVRARVRRASPAMPTGRCPTRWRAAARRALPLHAAQLPEPERALHRRGAPRRAGRRGAQRAGLAAGRGQPVRRPLVRRAAAAAAGVALARRHASTSARSRRCWRRGCAWATWSRRRLLFPKLLQAKQAADLHTPGFNQRMVHEVDPRRLPARPRADHPRPLQGAARRDAAALAQHLRRRLPLDARPAAACSSGSSCPPALDAAALLPEAVARGMAFVPGRRLLRRAAAAEHLAPVLRDRGARADRAGHRGARRRAGRCRSHDAAAIGRRDEPRCAPTVRRRCHGRRA